MFRSFFFVVTIIPWTLLMSVAGLPLSLISPDWLHTWGRWWARVGLLLAGVRLTVRGTEHIPSGHSAVFMPNHASNIDILVMFAGHPGQFRWLAKIELFRIPIFGLTMRRAGYIPVDRSDRRKAIISMGEAAKRIAEGTSVIIFPEGTRTPHGRLQPFKKGGFMLARQSGAPIVPVAIRGSYAVMAKHSLRLRPGRVELEFFPAVASDDEESRPVEELMAEVRRPIAAALGETDAA